MAKQTKQVDIYPDRVDGPNEERHIVAGDWRDPDRVQLLDGLRVQSSDRDWQENHSSSEPDWSAGFYGVDVAGRTVDLLAVFRDAVLNGLVLCGVVVARDESRHN